MDARSGGKGRCNSGEHRDEVVVVLLFGQGTLTAEAYLEGTQVAKTDDFIILDGFCHYIFKGYETDHLTTFQVFVCPILAKLK